MKLLDGTSQSSKLYEGILARLNANDGDLLIIATGGIGLRQDDFNRISTAFSKWLAASDRRKIYLYIGDWRGNSDSDETESLIRGLAKIVAYDQNTIGRVLVSFVPRLHAKFYSVWSTYNKNQPLEWFALGSSNLTSPALNRENLELDVLFDNQNASLPAEIVGNLARFIRTLAEEKIDDLDEKLDRLTDDLFDQHVEDTRRARNKTKYELQRDMKKAIQESNIAHQIDGRDAS